MSNVKKRIEGKAEELTGTVYGAVGEMTGSQRMEVEGAIKSIKGRAKQAAAKASERAKGAAESLTGKAKRVAGSILGAEQMENEGGALELKGKARQEANR